MSPRRRLVFLISLLMLPWPSQAAEQAPFVREASVPLTLDEAYALALRRSEDVAIRRELITETEGRFLQAFSGALPRASFVWSEKRQDGAGTSAFTLSRVPERRFTVTQPLFGGFKEFAAMAGSRSERRQRTFERQRAEQLLLTDVANAFYLLLEQREELATFEVIRVALVDRLDELHEREQLGRTRPSEVAGAEAQLRRVEAELQLVRSREQAARQLLEFLTGLKTIEAVADEAHELPMLEPQDASLAKAPQRPDVQAQQQALQVAKRQVAVARAKLLPTADVEGNYYTERVGAAADVDWDVLLTVDVPIFQGGQAVGAWREAASKARQAQWRAAQVARSARLDIEQAHTELAAALEQHAALAQALQAAEDNYRLQAADYRLNLVSNLDVLQALQALEDARRETLHAYYEAKRLFWRLRVATGEGLA